MFGMSPNDDPVKSAYMMAGLGLLSGGDINSTLQNLPQMVMKAKQLKQEQALALRRMAIDEAQLGIQKSANEREAAKQKDLKTFGDTFKKYDLHPNLGGMDLSDPNATWNVKNPAQGPDNWSAGSMVTRDMKGDAAMPIAEAGNPVTKSIMALPDALRSGMAAAPLTAAAIATPGMQDAMTRSLGGVTPGQAPNVVNLKGADGVTMSFDIGDPNARAAAQKAMSEGAVEVNPASPPGEKPAQVHTFVNQKTKETMTLDMNDPQDRAKFAGVDKSQWVEAPAKTIAQTTTDPATELMSTYTNQIKDVADQANKAADQSENYSILGSLLVSPNTYTGVGANLLNGIIGTGQSAFGVWKDQDVSTPQAALKMRNQIVSNLRKDFAKDTQFSNTDHKFLDSMVPDNTDQPMTIAQTVAMQQLRTTYLQSKSDFLMQQIQGGASSYEALRAWDKQHDKVLKSVFTKANRDEIASHIMEGANDQSLLDKAKSLNFGDTAAQVTGQVENAAGMKSQDQLPQEAPPIKGDDDPVYKALPSGSKYTAPDGKVRMKQ